MLPLSAPVSKVILCLVIIRCDEALWEKALQNTKLCQLLPSWLKGGLALPNTADKHDWIPHPAAISIRDRKVMLVVDPFESPRHPACVAWSTKPTGMWPRWMWTTCLCASEALAVRKPQEPLAETSETVPRHESRCCRLNRTCIVFRWHGIQNRLRLRGCWSCHHIMTCSVL